MYRLQVTAGELNIRNSPNADPTYANRIGSLMQGTIFNAEQLVTGQAYEGNDQWYKDSFNRYYWAGGVKQLPPLQEAPPVQPSVTPAAPVVNAAIPQWMNDLRLPEIWQRATGSGVGIAIVDTGIAPGIADLPYNTTSFYTYAPGVQLTDNSGHGTNCAALAGARNKAGNYIGVAPGCNLYICKISENIFFDNPATDTMRYADAINWCAGQKDIHVISVSWGNPITDASILGAIQGAVANAIKNNKVVICAMGEAYSFGEATELYPACTSGSFGIGAIPVTDTLYPFVNSHLLAVTSGTGMPSYYKDGSIQTMDGTSQSNAAAAGIIALMIQKTGFNYTPASIRQDLQKLLKPTSFTADGTTLTLPVIDGGLLLQYFTTAT